MGSEKNFLFQVIQGGKISFDTSPSHGKVNNPENPATSPIFLTAPGVNTGLSLGSLIELSGSHSWEWLLQMLQQNPQVKVYWAERDSRSHPTVLHKAGVSINRITFGNLGEDLFQPLYRVLQSHRYQIVIAPSRFCQPHELKALENCAEKSKSLVLLLKSGFSPAQGLSHLQYEVQSCATAGFKVMTNRN